MKNCLKKLLSLSPLLFLLACNQFSFSGNLDVKSPLLIKGSKDKDLSLDIGHFASELKLKSNGKVVMSVGDDKVSFKLPRHTKFPEHNGTVILSAEEIEQDFDLQIDVSTRTSTSNSWSTTEQCSRVVGTRVVCHNEGGDLVCRDVPGERVCHEEGGGMECHEENGRRICRKTEGHQVCVDKPSHEVCHRTEVRRVCVNEDVYQYGSRNVVYHSVTTSKDIKVNFKALGSSDFLASLAGVAESSSTDVMDSVGSCRF